MRRTGCRGIDIRPKIFSNLLFCLGILAFAARADAQFRDDFDRLATDPSGKEGWRFRTGEGAALMDVVQGGEGYAAIRVDATADRRNVWWALFQRETLRAKPGREVRISARIRSSHAPRRVNLQIQTPHTTDYHSHLMEFDLSEANRWETISMTTRGFDAKSGDPLIAHMALMDWGTEKYQVDVDWVRVDLVDCRTDRSRCPSSPNSVPYHPPIPSTSAFSQSLTVSSDTMIDSLNPEVNLDDWSDGSVRLLTVSPALSVILRWDFGEFGGKRIKGSGLLELTTRAAMRTAREIHDSGLLRVSEINGAEIIPQPVIDWRATPGDGGKTYLTISRPVLQRLLDGRTTGIAIRALGPLSASFYASEGNGNRAARLWFNVE
jgi:hypothetical protein